MANIEISTKQAQQTGLSVQSPVTSHPAVIAAGAKLSKAAERLSVRQYFNGKALLAAGQKETALAGLVMDINEIITRMGTKQANRSTPQTVLMFAESVLEACPTIIPASLDGSIMGELLAAYKAAAAGKLEDVNLNLWGDGPNDRLFILLAVTYVRLQSIPEIAVQNAISEWKESDPAKAYREAVAHRVDSLVIVLGVLHARDTENPIKRGDIPAVLSFGLGYDVMLAAGLISPSNEDKRSAFAYAESAVKAEASSKTRAAETRQGAAFVGGAFDSIIAAYQKDAKAAVISTAKDLLFLTALNDEKFDRLQAIGTLKKNKAAIIESETARLLAASNQNPKQ